MAWKNLEFQKNKKGRTEFIQLFWSTTKEGVDAFFVLDLFGFEKKLKILSQVVYLPVGLREFHPMPHNI